MKLIKDKGWFGPRWTMNVQRNKERMLRSALKIYLQEGDVFFSYPSCDTPFQAALGLAKAGWFFGFSGVVCHKCTYSPKMNNSECGNWFKEDPTIIKVPFYVDSMSVEYKKIQMFGDDEYFNCPKCSEKMRLHGNTHLYYQINKKIADELKQLKDVGGEAFLDEVDFSTIFPRYGKFQR